MQRFSLLLLILQQITSKMRLHNHSQWYHKAFRCLTNELTSKAHILSTPPLLLHRVYSHFCVCDASLPACLQNQILCLLLGQSSSRACGCISKGTEHYGFSCGLLQLHIQAFIRCCVSGGNKVTPYLQLVWSVLELGSVQGASRKASANPLVLLEQKDPWLLVWGQRVSSRAKQGHL